MLIFLLQHCVQRKGRYLSYSQADFEVFLTRRGDMLHGWGEIWRGGVAQVHSSVPNFTIRNMNAPQKRIPCAIFTKFVEFLLCPMTDLLKYGSIC